MNKNLSVQRGQTKDKCPRVTRANLETKFWRGIEGYKVLQEKMTKLEHKHTVPTPSLVMTHCTDTISGDDTIYR